jgi:hypothetical protein
MTQPEFCKHGHEWTPENTKTNPKTGARQCRTCRRNRDAQVREQYKKPTTFQHYRQG